MTSSTDTVSGKRLTNGAKKPEQARCGREENKAQLAPLTQQNKTPWTNRRWLHKNDVRDKADEAIGDDGAGVESVLQQTHCLFQKDGMIVNQ